MAEKKKPRVVVVINEGLLEAVYADAELDIELLKADLDEQAEEPEVYRREEIVVDPEAVERHFQSAREFWDSEEELGMTP